MPETKPKKYAAMCETRLLFDRRGYPLRMGGHEVLALVYLKYDKDARRMNYDTIGSDEPFHDAENPTTVKEAAEAVMITPNEMYRVLRRCMDHGLAQRKKKKLDAPHFRYEYYMDLRQGILTRRMEKEAVELVQNDIGVTALYAFLRANADV